MPAFTHCRRVTLATAALAFWAALGPAGELTEESQAAFRRTVRIPNEFEAQAVRHAVTLAGRRLSQEGCGACWETSRTAPGSPSPPACETAAGSARGLAPRAAALAT